MRGCSTNGGSNIGWSAAGLMVNSNGETTWNNGSVTGALWAAIYNPCSSGWRVLSGLDFRKLTDPEKVVSVWNTRQGVVGRLFSGDDRKFDIHTSRGVLLSG
jgi:hypothetical protein